MAHDILKKKIRQVVIIYKLVTCHLSGHKSREVASTNVLLGRSANAERHHKSRGTYEIV